jgi:hypothetical protein
MKFPLIISVMGTHACYHHIVVIWRGMIIDYEKIRPWARGLRVMRVKTIGRGRGGHPWWAQPLFVMIKYSIKASKAIAGQEKVIRVSASGMRA